MDQSFPLPTGLEKSSASLLNVKQGEQFRALISGGKGDLAAALCHELSANDWEIFAPGRTEMDVTDEESVHTFIQHCPKLDLIVANAGKVHDQLLLRQSEADWDQILRVNLDGAARLARLAGNRLKLGGLLVFVGSHSAHHPPLGQVAYASAKAGLEGLVRSLAQEWGQTGRRVNLVEPGLMQTRMTKNMSPSVLEERRHQHALKNFNDPNAVARFIRFLHDALPMTSGQCFRLDSRPS